MVNWSAAEYVTPWAQMTLPTVSRSLPASMWMAREASTWGSSSTPAFIEAVSPEYAVIEVGEGNSYGHPKTEVVNRLLSHGCAIYTTMDNGNIVFTCDGENFRIYTDQQTGDFRQDTEEAA